MINRIWLKHGVTIVTIVVLGFLALGSSVMGPSARVTETASREPFSVAVQYHIVPEIGAEVEANIGDSILQKEWRTASMSFIYLDKPLGNESMQHYIPQGICKPVFKQGNSTIYQPTVKVDGLHTSELTEDQNGEVHWSGRGTPLYQADGYTKRTLTYDTSGNFKEQLIFTGISGSVIRLSYRESDRTSPVEVTYDMAQDKVIGYKGASFEVIEYNNRGIKYKLISGFQTPKEQEFMTADQFQAAMK
jgi:hypothetical protein